MRRSVWSRRQWLLLAGVLGGTAAAAREAAADEAAAWDALRRDGAIVLFRHAHAPGVGDPPQWRIGDCRTQRNLDERGRAQARRIGQRLREQGVRVGAVWTSRWCRARDTAVLMAVGAVQEVPAFDSFFAERGQEPQRTAAARERLRSWRGPGALVVVTHQVNISALTGQSTASGEGLVLLQPPGDGALAVVGRIETAF